MDQYNDIEDEALISRVKAAAGGDDPFVLPPHYFEELPGHIIRRARLEETISREPVFTVPADYFETLSSRISARTEPVVAAVKVRRLTSWLGYAAAACITLALAITLLVNQRSQLNVEDQLAVIPEQAIIDYLQESSSPGDVAFIKDNLSDASDLSAPEPLSDQEIEQYLDNTLYSDDEI